MLSIVGRLKQMLKSPPLKKKEKGKESVNVARNNLVIQGRVITMENPVIEVKVDNYEY
jgi:hypothetical protein